MIRQGLRLILESEPGITVVGEAADGRDALEMVPRARPDVVLMDVRMPRLDGIEACRLIRDAASGELPYVLMLTTFDLEDYVYAALRAGASGFLLKDAPAEQLVAAVEVVARGDALLAPQVTRLLIEEVARRRSPDPERGPRPRPPHRARGRGAAPDGPRDVEQRDRRPALPRRGDGEDPRRAGPRQARRPRPRAGRRGRLRVRPRRAGHRRQPITLAPEGRRAGRRGQGPGGADADQHRPHEGRRTPAGRRRRRRSPGRRRRGAGPGPASGGAQSGRWMRIPWGRLSSKPKRA